ncbi:unnamed protein product, partial [marine sediment metagenome]
RPSAPVVFTSAANALAADVADDVATTIYVDSAAGFPAAPFYITVDSEVMLVTAMAGVGNTEWTVERGQNGTTAAPHLASAPVVFTPAANTLAVDVTDLLDTTIVVTSAAGFPAPATPFNDFYIIVDSEVMLVTAMSGPGNTVWGVDRGQKGTTAASHLASAPVVFYAATDTLAADVDDLDTTTTIY